MFDSEFYPTPPHIAYKMLAKVSKDAEHFLEPSAGKGDIATVIKGEDRYTRRNVDCIEQSPELAAILADKGFPVVGHDWLTYSGVCYYDAILMNPPFSNGDEHLLRAWEFLHNGEIVCLLNAETINNPFSPRRQQLCDIIAKHGHIDWLGDCFSTAERKTGVNVAIVYLKKEAEDDRIDLWAKGAEEKTANEDIGGEQNLPALIDRLGNMQHFYDQANEHMLKAFQHIRKASLFLAANGIGLGYEDGYKKAAALAFDNMNSARAEFGRKHRRDAWLQVFEKMEFRKWLDKKQTDEFVRDIERNGNIPFTKENIKGTLENVFLQRRMLFEKSVANVFDELTRYYNGNTNHTEGWKSNDGYKVNQKLVFPYGCTFDWGSFKLWGYSSRIDIYNDLDRAMCVLDGQDFAQCHTIGQALENKFRILGHNVKSPFDNTTESRYFNIRFFKKGTVHLVFKDKHLLQEFNKTAAKGKAWIGQQTQNNAA